MRKALIFLCLLLATVNNTQAQKKIIDQDAYGRWRTIEAPSISKSGKWVLSRVSSAIRDNGNPHYQPTFLHVFNTEDHTSFDIPYIRGAMVSPDEEYLLYKIPSTPGNRLSRDSSIILNLKTGERQPWKKGGAFSSLQNSEYIYYQETKPFMNTSRYVFLNLKTRDSIQIDNVDRLLFYDENQSVFYLKREPDSTRTIWTGKINGTQHRLDNELKGSYVRHFLENDNRSLSLFMASDKQYETNPDLVYRVDLHTRDIRFVLDWKTVSIPKGINPNISGEINRYAFAELEPAEEKLPTDNKEELPGNLELWSWDDNVIPSAQSPAQRAYRPKYIYNIAKNRWVCISNSPEEAAITPANQGDYVLKMNYAPYRRSSDWTERVPGDLYLIDLQDGTETLIQKQLWEKPTWSPNGKYAIVYHEKEKNWYALNCKTKEFSPVSHRIPHPVYQEDHDSPDSPPPYGFAAWAAGGNAIIVADKYDLWLLELNGKQKTTCLTSGYGRKHKQEMRMVLYEDALVKSKFRDNEADLNNNMLIIAKNKETQAEAYYALKPGGKLEKLMGGDYTYRFVNYSEDGKKCIWRRMNYEEYFDLWVSNSDFSNPTKVMETNPQQKEYNWGSAKIINWKNPAGKHERGVLYLPENYDSAKKYPLIVNFYERHTHRLNEYHMPDYSHSTINIPTYVSRGYAVFSPDIHYNIGHPGQSAHDAVMSGVNMLINNGIADKNSIGVQGHSWGGFQVGYLVAHTNLFRCAQIGAGIVNAVSGYTGLRGDGAPRMFMYELTQSRLGATLWENTDVYLENSPILMADKITAPLLILHNDKDEAVPYTQGLDLFFAMRRLQKSAWLFNYKGEGHFLNNRAAMRDWTERMQQFFDFYLQNGDKPSWMKESGTD